MTPTDFRTARKRLGFTQEDVAARYDVTRETVAQFERGRVSSPRWDLADAVAWFRDMLRARTVRGRP